MFRSSRRAVVFPQAEHARFSAALAALWGNERFERPALDFDAFVRGVALHDRGYGELDADGIGEVSSERWLEIQRRSFEPRGEDPVVDLVVAMHVHRLLSKPWNPALAVSDPELEASLPALRAAAGVGEDEAGAADAITDLCDRIAFDVCVEERSEWDFSIAPGVGADPVEVAFAFDGAGTVTLDPWPLGVPWARPVLCGFAADGYPDRHAPVVEPILVRPV
ncbi:MAG TPA: DUF3891 family protein [Gaiellaceae bacterium]